jgi:hypothetical protein
MNAAEAARRATGRYDLALIFLHNMLNSFLNEQAECTTLWTKSLYIHYHTGIDLTTSAEGRNIPWRW